MKTEAYGGIIDTITGSSTSAYLLIYFKQELLSGEAVKEEYMIDEPTECVLHNEIQDCIIQQSTEVRSVGLQKDEGMIKQLPEQHSIKIDKDEVAVQNERTVKRSVSNNEGNKSVEKKIQNKSFQPKNMSSVIDSFKKIGKFL